MENDENKLTWMNSEDAAKHLRISKSRLHNLTSLGHIKYHKMGRSNRYRRENLDALIVKKDLFNNDKDQEKKED